MGIDQKRSRQAIALPAPLTLAFIPYGYHLPELTEAAHAAGHELLVHLPMEPMDADADPGPNALLTSLSHDEIMRRLRWGLSRFAGYVGLNNHMGRSEERSVGKESVSQSNTRGQRDPNKKKKSTT